MNMTPEEKQKIINLYTSIHKGSRCEYFVDAINAMPEESDSEIARRLYRKWDINYSGDWDWEVWLDQGGE